MRSYLRKLNWSGVLFMLLLAAIGVTGYMGVETFGQGMFLMVTFGVPMSSFFLFAGKED